MRILFLIIPIILSINVNAAPIDNARILKGAIGFTGAKLYSKKAKWPRPFGPVDDLTVKTEIFGNSLLDPIEGIWTYSEGNYRIAIIRNKPELKSKYKYSGVILSSKQKSWSNGDLKFSLHESSSHIFPMRYYKGNRSPIELPMILNEQGTSITFNIPTRTQSLKQHLIKEWPNGSAIMSRQNLSSKGKTIKTGTGFKISSSHFVTAYHVIANTQSIVLNTGNISVPAKIVSKDWANNLAILEVANEDLNKIASISSLKIGSAKKAKEGSKVFSIGYPLIGELSTQAQISKGTISSSLGFLDDPRSFQISMPPQDEYNGEPLLNEQGEVIGVITDILRTHSSRAITNTIPQNTNFAVKINYVESLFSLTPRLDKKLLDKTASTKILTTEGIMSKYKNSIVLIRAE